eukprot:1152185-Pelagomonas_calceolata.AAC.8
MRSHICRSFPRAWTWVQGRKTTNRGRPNPMLCQDWHNIVRLSQCRAGVTKLYASVGELMSRSHQLAMR